MTEIASITKASGILSIKRSAKYFALQFSDSITFLSASDIKKNVQINEASTVDLSILDDVALVGIYKEKVPRFINIATSKEETLPAVAPGAGCSAYRVRESESVDSASRESLTYAVQCKKFLGLFTLTISDFSIVPIFKTQGATLGSIHHGALQTVFRSAKSFLVQFADLSLHFYDLPATSGTARWVREESLSQIKQVELLAQDGVRIESELEYVKNVKQKVSVASIPTLIINRYKENFNYLVNHLEGLFKSGRSAVKDGLQSTFGFKKVFLLLTDVGRLVALSATDGQVQWTEYLGSGAQKIIVRNMLEREIQEKGEDTLTQQISAIVGDTIFMINPTNGQKVKEYFMAPVEQGQQRDFIIISLTQSRAQFILAITSDALQQGKPLVAYPPE